MNTEVNAGAVNTSALEIAPESPIDLPYTPDELGELAVDRLHYGVKRTTEIGQDPNAKLLFESLDLSRAASAVLANTFLLRIANAYERVATVADRSEARESSLESLRRQQLEVMISASKMQLSVTEAAFEQVRSAADAAFSLARFLDLYDPERNTVQELTARLELFRKDLRSASADESEQKS